MTALTMTALAKALEYTSAMTSLDNFFFELHTLITWNGGSIALTPFRKSTFLTHRGTLWKNKIGKLCN